MIIWPKQLMGAATARFTPQCSFEQAIFVIGHMRCGSTALSHILCSQPDISGYGEAHITYRSEADLGLLALNQWRRGAWKPKASHLFDKILHSRYDGDPPASFFAARAIFVARSPEPSIASIRNLFREIGSEEYQHPGEAEAYYRDRLKDMLRLWDRFPSENRIGVRYEDLVENPDATLDGISRHLGVSPPLANVYVANKAARSRGAGDPLVAAFQTKIVKKSDLADNLEIKSEILSNESSKLFNLFIRNCCGY